MQKLSRLPDRKLFFLLAENPFHLGDLSSPWAWNTHMLSRPWLFSLLLPAVWSKHNHGNLSGPSKHKKISARNFQRFSSLKKKECFYQGELPFCVDPLCAILGDSRLRTWRSYHEGCTCQNSENRRIAE